MNSWSLRTLTVATFAILLAVASTLALPLSASSRATIPASTKEVHQVSELPPAAQLSAATNFAHGVASPIGEVNVTSLPPPSNSAAYSTHRLRVPDPSAYVMAKKQSNQWALGGAGSSPAGAQPPNAVNSLVLAIGTGFDGLQYDNAVPPDVQVAAGPNHIMEMVNVEGEIWTKQGVPLKIFSLSSFFNTGSDYIGDPKVLYDSMSGRWFASLLRANTSSVVIAVSETNDPTGMWYFYNFPAAFGDCPDQPIIGMSNDVFVISVNDFVSPCAPGEGTFEGAQYWILNKTDVVARASVHYNTFGPDRSLFSVHPVKSLSSTSTQFMVSAGSSGSNFLQLFSVSGVPPSPVIVNTLHLPISMTRAPPNATQLGTTSLIDTGDARVQDAAWYKGKLWVSFNDACTPSGDAQLRSCLRLVEVDTSVPLILQDFDVSASGKFYFYPALSIDSQGNVVFVFGYSSSADYPSIAVSAQAISDPAETWEQPKTLKSGLGPETSYCPSTAACRYGDYFGASLDPTDPSMIWVAGEYGSAISRWATFIGSVRVFVTAVPLTLSYSVAGGGSGYATPTLSYSSGGVPQMATLRSSPTTYYLDVGSRWGVTNPLAGTSSNERWQTNQLTNGTATSSQTINFVYYHQFNFNFNYEIRGKGTGYSLPVVTYTIFGVSNFEPANTSVWIDSGGVWSITNPLQGSSSNERWQSDSVTSGMASNPEAHTIAYHHQYSLALSYSIAGGGTPSAPTLIGTQFSKSYSAAITANPIAYWLDEGSTWSVGNPLGGTSPRERWQTNQVVSGIISSSFTGVFIYRHQYQLLVEPSPSEGGGVSPSSNWYDVGTSVQISASTNSGWQFQGWIGAGAGSYSGPNSSALVTVESPIAENANFYAGLTISATNGGLASYTYGSASGTIPEGESRTIFVAPGTNVSLTALPSSFLYAFTAWGGAISTNADKISVTVTSPLSMHANYTYNYFTIGLIIVAVLGLVVTVTFAARRRQKG